MNGLVLINKPPGITSFQVLTPLKKILAPAKIGHAGTLDRFADGLLAVLTGKYTRLAGLFTRLDKEYRATVVFGTGTATDDPEGEVIGSGPVPEGDDLAAILPRFRGRIMQRPPKYSAVHVNGRRASDCARQGLAVELEPRPVVVYSLELLHYDPPRAELLVSCSKGTYIRSLARDLAAALRTYAFVERLTRVRIGGLTLAEAVTPEAFDPSRHVRTGSDFIVSLPAVNRVTATSRLERDIRFGRPLDPRFFSGSPLEGENIVLSESGELLAVIDCAGTVISYKMVFND